MKRTVLLGWACVLLSMCVLAGEQVVTLHSRPGVSERFLLLQPTGPVVANVILLTGGEGAIRLDEQGRLGAADNFLVRSRALWAMQGFQVAVVDTPSDHSRGISYNDFRSSPEHAQDIAAVSDALRQRVAVPVWLVGTSRGTSSAASVAIWQHDKVDGVVLTSTINHGRGNVAAMALDKLTQPVLLVQHVHDECKETRYQNVQAVLDGLVNARAHELMLFDGGISKGDPCQPWAAHGYNGMRLKS